MNSFGSTYRALIIGANGAIGSSLIAQLELDPHCSAVVGISRHSQTPIDISSEASIEQAAHSLRQEEPFDLIILATGVLQTALVSPEKKLDQINLAALQAVFSINTFGPALVIKHFSPLLGKQRSMLVCISAKVGSIEDNRLGGWYSYRASKAALNMLVKTAGIEIKRTLPQATLVAMHPGTVRSPLSEPFGGAKTGQDPMDAATKILLALDQIPPESSAIFLSYDGSTIPW